MNPAPPCLLQSRYKTHFPSPVLLDISAPEGQITWIPHWIKTHTCNLNGYWNSTGFEYQHKTRQQETHLEESVKIDKIAYNIC